MANPIQFRATKSQTGIHFLPSIETTQRVRNIVAHRLEIAAKQRQTLHRSEKFEKLPPLIRTHEVQVSNEDTTLLSILRISPEPIKKRSFSTHE